MRWLAVVTLLLTSAPARAGGLGVLGGGGMHTELVYFYSDVDDAGNPYANFRDFDQYQLTQNLMNFGGGLELMIGDRDDKITGVFRGLYNYDQPQSDPAAQTSLVDPENVVAAYRDYARHTGIAKLGVNWGIIGDPQNGLQLALLAMAGAGFLTQDHAEFLIADIGPSVQYRTSRTTAVFLDATYSLRWRKYPSHGAAGAVGFRYLFD